MGGKVYATDPLFIERLQNKRMAYMPSGADCWVGPKEDPAQLPKPLNVKKQRNVAYNLYQGKDYPDIIDKEIVIPDAWKKKFDDLSKFKGFTSLDIEAQFRGIGSVMYYNRATGEPGIIHVHREEVVNL